MGDLERVWVRVAGLTLHARVADRSAPPGAPAVVCVHGLVVSGRYMVPLARRLAPHCRVYVPDLPGSGRSEDPARVPTISGQADLLAAWMEAMGLQRATVVGNSVGCQVVAQLGRRHPERLARAVLIGPTVDAKGRTTLEQVRRLATDMLREPLSSFPLLLQDVRDSGVRHPLWTWVAALEDRLEVSVGGLAAPVLVVRGGRDPIAPVRWTTRLAALAPWGRHVTVPGAAHIVHFSHPDEVARIVRDFIDQTGDPVAGVPTLTPPPARLPGTPAGRR